MSHDDDRAVPRPVAFFLVEPVVCATGPDEVIDGDVVVEVRIQGLIVKVNVPVGLSSPAASADAAVAYVRDQRGDCYEFSGRDWRIRS